MRNIPEGTLQLRPSFSGYEIQPVRKGARSWCYAQINYAKSIGGNGALRSGKVKENNKQQQAMNRVALTTVLLCSNSSVFCFK